MAQEAIGPHTLSLANRPGTDREAADQLLKRVGDRLRRQAGRLVANDRAGHELGVTDLIDRAYERLYLGRNHDRAGRWVSGSHFRNAFARMMRCVLIEHALTRVRRERILGKFAGAPAALSLDELSNLDVVKLYRGDPHLILDVAEAFRKLERSHPKWFQVAYRCTYGGQTTPQAAADLGIPVRTASHHHAMALSFLRNALRDLRPIASGSVQT
jgi:DNA-directed RNA polymerase specialized sigma24 family protein